MSLISAWIPSVKLLGSKHWNKHVFSMSNDIFFYLLSKYFFCLTFVNVCYFQSLLRGNLLEMIQSYSSSLMGNLTFFFFLLIAGQWRIISFWIVCNGKLLPIFQNKEIHTCVGFFIYFSTEKHNRENEKFAYMISCSVCVGVHVCEGTLCTMFVFAG